MTSTDLKRQAARAALDLVQSGMRLGLGTGSTAHELVDLLGQRVRDGLDVIAVPTSEATQRQARSLGIRIATLDEYPQLDLVIDGADEIDAQLQLVKGGGGALLREKIVAFAGARMVVIADATKVVSVLGAFPLPIEIAPFGAEATRRAIVAGAAELGYEGPIHVRETRPGHAFVTDGGHIIFDAAFGRISDARALARVLSDIPGVVEHGLFIDVADLAYIAAPEGVTELRRAR